MRLVLKRDEEDLWVVAEEDSRSLDLAWRECGKSWERMERMACRSG